MGRLLPPMQPYLDAAYGATLGRLIPPIQPYLDTAYGATIGRLFPTPNAENSGADDEAQRKLLEQQQKDQEEAQRKLLEQQQKEQEDAQRKLLEQQQKEQEDAQRKLLEQQQKDQDEAQPKNEEQKSELAISEEEDIPALARSFNNEENNNVTIDHKDSLKLIAPPEKREITLTDKTIHDEKFPTNHKGNIPQSLDENSVTTTAEQTATLSDSPKTMNEATSEPSVTSQLNNNHTPAESIHSSTSTPSSPSSSSDEVSSITSPQQSIITGSADQGEASSISQESSSPKSNSAELSLPDNNNLPDSSSQILVATENSVEPSAAPPQENIISEPTTSAEGPQIKPTDTTLDLQADQAEVQSENNSAKADSVPHQEKPDAPLESTSPTINRDELVNKNIESDNSLQTLLKTEDATDLTSAKENLISSGPITPDEPQTTPETSLDLPTEATEAQSENNSAKEDPVPHQEKADAPLESISPAVNSDESYSDKELLANNKELQYDFHIPENTPRIESPNQLGLLSSPDVGKSVGFHDLPSLSNVVKDTSEGLGAAAVALQLISNIPLARTLGAGTLAKQVASASNAISPVKNNFAGNKIIKPSNTLEEIEEQYSDVSMSYGEVEDLVTENPAKDKGMGYLPWVFGVGASLVGALKTGVANKVGSWFSSPPSPSRDNKTTETDSSKNKAPIYSDLLKPFFPPRLKPHIERLKYDLSKTNKEKFEKELLQYMHTKILGMSPSEKTTLSPDIKNLYQYFNETYGTLDDAATHSSSTPEWTRNTGVNSNNDVKTEDLGNGETIEYPSPETSLSASFFQPSPLGASNTTQTSSRVELNLSNSSD